LLSTQRYRRRTAGRGQQLRAPKQDNVLNIDSYKRESFFALPNPGLGVPDDEAAE